MYRILVSLFVVLLAGSASADWTSIASYQAAKTHTQSILRHEWAGTATATTAYDISSCTNGVEARFDASVTDSSTDATFEFRMMQNSTDAFSKGRPIYWPGPSDGLTWVGINALTSGENYIIARPLTTTAGGDTARVEIRCTANAALGGGSGGVLIQANPSVAADLDATTEIVTDPATVKFGFGVTTAAPDTFTAKTYNGGSTTGNEADNQFGIYYNKAGVGSSTIPNRFEHSIDRSFETAYRSTGGTSDETWMEENLDIVPPDFSAPTTSSSTSGWVAGDTLTFSGGGTGRLLSVSGSDPTKTVLWRQDYGTTAAGETVSNVTHPTSAATLGTLTANGTSWRSFLWVYRTLANTTSWYFFNQPSQSFPTLDISSNVVKTNGNVIVSGTGSSIYGPAIWAISNGGAFDTGTEVCTSLGFTCQSTINFAGLGVSPTSVACGTTITSTQTFIAMCK